MPRKIRGSGFKHTLSAVRPFTTFWLIIVVLAAPVTIVGMVFGDLIAESARGDVWFFLLTRMPVIILAVAGLALFTTTRTAGPFVALQRAFEDVKNGDLSRRLSLRRGDKHLRELETMFNDMMASIAEEKGKGPNSGQGAAKSRIEDK